MKAVIRSCKTKKVVHSPENIEVEILQTILFGFILFIFISFHSPEKINFVATRKCNARNCFLDERIYQNGHNERVFEEGLSPNCSVVSENCKNYTKIFGLGFKFLDLLIQKL